VICQDCHCPYGQNQEDAKSARYSTAGVQDQRNRGGVYSGVDQCDDAQARPFQPARDDQQDARCEIGDAGG